MLVLNQSEQQNDFIQLPQIIKDEKAVYVVDTAKSSFKAYPDINSEKFQTLDIEIGNYTYLEFFTDSESLYFFNRKDIQKLGGVKPNNFREISTDVYADDNDVFVYSTVKEKMYKMDGADSMSFIINWDGDACFSVDALYTDEHNAFFYDNDSDNFKKIQNLDLQNVEFVYLSDYYESCKTNILKDKGSYYYFTVKTDSPVKFSDASNGKLVPYLEDGNVTMFLKMINIYITTISKQQLLQEQNWIKPVLKS